MSAKALKLLPSCAGKEHEVAAHHNLEESFTFVDTIDKEAPIAGVSLLCGYVRTETTVTYVSSAVYVVVMRVSLAVREVEMNRENLIGPYSVSWKISWGAVVDFVSHGLHPDGDANELLAKNILKISKDHVDVLVKVDEKTMRVSEVLESVKHFWKKEN